MPEQEERFVSVTLAISERKLDRLKAELPHQSGRSFRRSATQAIEEAIDLCISNAGSVVLSRNDRLELASRSGRPVPANRAEIMECFVACTSIGPNTVHFEMDAMIANEVRNFCLQTEMGFQDQCKTIIEQAAVETYMYSTPLRGLFFMPGDWGLLLETVGWKNKTPPTGGELVKVIAGQAVVRTLET